MLTKRKKANEIKKGQRHDSDTGSPEVQIALLTRRIEELSAHLDKNRKDKVRGTINALLWRTLKWVLPMARTVVRSVLVNHKSTDV
jgi:hypothetical protein